jgi:hypothetical protein
MLPECLCSQKPLSYDCAHVNILHDRDHAFDCDYGRDDHDDHDRDDHDGYDHDGHDDRGSFSLDLNA